MKRIIHSISVVLITLTLFAFPNTIVASTQDKETLDMILDSLLSLSPKDAFTAWHKLMKKDNEYALNNEISEEKFKYFIENFKEAKEHNSKNLSWKKGLDKFSDLSKEEFTKNYLNYKIKSKNNERNDSQAATSNWGNFRYFISFFTRKDPVNLQPIDWRSYCPKVHSQRCGSCWADAVSTAVECNYNIKYPNNRIEISTQHIIDCDISNSGCRGGDPESATIFTGVNGFMEEKHYKTTYTPDQICKESDLAKNGILPKKVVSGLETVCYVWYEDKAPDCRYSTPLYKVLQKGPLSTALDANKLAGYKSGIIDFQGCERVNHVVVIVGYGIDSQTNKAYWIIKNSWGNDWGEMGYVRVLVKDDTDKNCYMYNSVYRPIIS